MPDFTAMETMLTDSNRTDKLTTNNNGNTINSLNNLLKEGDEEDITHLNKPKNDKRFNQWQKDRQDHFGLVE